MTLGAVQQIGIVISNSKLQKCPVRIVWPKNDQTNAWKPPVHWNILSDMQKSLYYLVYIFTGQQICRIYHYELDYRTSHDTIANPQPWINQFSSSIYRSVQNIIFLSTVQTLWITVKYQERPWIVFPQLRSQKTNKQNTVNHHRTKLAFLAETHKWYRIIMLQCFSLTETNTRHSCFLQHAHQSIHPISKANVKRREIWRMVSIAVVFCI